ncbi:MAG: AAA family ATPase [Desulfobaccales bacterium]
MDRVLVVIFGLMGVGKTTVAKALSQVRGWPVIHSDAVRKALAGLAPTTPAHFGFGEGIYREEFSKKTYAEMRRRAAALLDEGAPAVILDASFKSAAERQQVRELGQEKGARVVLVECVCPLEVVRERLRRREDNAAAISDGRLELLPLQAEDFEPATPADEPRLQLDTSRNLKEVLQELDGFLQDFLPSQR